MKNRTYIIVSIMELIVIFFSSCKSEEKDYGNIQIHFEHTVGCENVSLNNLQYTNAAGNQYLISEVKYFISNLFLVNDENEWIEIKNDNNIHYTDLNYPNTLTWNITNIPEGNYKYFIFTFGLNKENNITNRFVNPPEANFSWPTHLGGGYHYMQINGKWLDQSNTLRNMNFHTGIGQLYRNDSLSIDNIFAYIHNDFQVQIPIEKTILKNQTTSFNLIMNIDNWFKDPIIYDHNYFGSSIMQNQEAQTIIRQNGYNVFSLQ